MDYFKKLDQNPYPDLYWNIPEQKHGAVNVIGGNSQNFRSCIQTAEYLAGHFPLSSVTSVLPISLQPTLPNLPNLQFLPATDTGSFTGDKLLETMDSADYNLLAGDFSKNTITTQAIVQTLAEITKPTLLTRDTIDLLADHQPETLLSNPHLNLLGSLLQFKKLLASIYYPKRLLASQSLLQVVETLHKFTLSYPIGLVTLHNGQILVAQSGNVTAVPLENSGFSPLSLWHGEFASKITVLNLYNPGDFTKATIAAIYYQTR